MTNRVRGEVSPASAAPRVLRTDGYHFSVRARVPRAAFPSWTVVWPAWTAGQTGSNSHRRESPYAGYRMGCSRGKSPAPIAGKASSSSSLPRGKRSGSSRVIASEMGPTFSPPNVLRRLRAPRHRARSHTPRWAPDASRVDRPSPTLPVLRGGCRSDSLGAAGRLGHRLGHRLRARARRDCALGLWCPRGFPTARNATRLPVGHGGNTAPGRRPPDSRRAPERYRVLPTGLPKFDRWTTGQQLLRFMRSGLRGLWPAIRDHSRAVGLAHARCHRLRPARSSGETSVARGRRSKRGEASPG